MRNILYNYIQPKEPRFLKKIFVTLKTLLLHLIETRIFIMGLKVLVMVDISTMEDGCQ